MPATPVSVMVCARLARDAEAAVARHLPGARVIALPCVCDEAGPPTGRPPSPGAAPPAGEAACVLGCRTTVDRARSLLGEPPPSATEVPICMHLLADPAWVSGRLDAGDYLVTRAGLAGSRAHLDASGFDRDGARALFAESARRVLLLDTGVGEPGDRGVRDFADHVGLPWVAEPVGLERLGAAIAEAAGRARGLSAQARRCVELERRVAETSAVLDLTAEMGVALDEEAVVACIADRLFALFAPSRVVWLPTGTASASAPRVFPPEAAPPDEALLAELRSLASPALARGDRLLLRVSSVEELGRFAADGIAFPRFAGHYAEVAGLVAGAAALGLGHARLYSRLAHAEAEVRGQRDALQEALDKVRTLSGLLPICASCKRIRDDKDTWVRVEEYVTAHSSARFTHGVCPDCCQKLFAELEVEDGPSGSRPR